MKIRTGFVSNSSTSSFVIYGVHLNIDEQDSPELYDYLEMHGGWIRGEGGVSLVGVTLAYGDNYEVTCFDPNDPELKQEAQVIADKIGVPLSEFKFYAGTVYG